MLSVGSLSQRSDATFEMRLRSQTKQSQGVIIKQNLKMEAISSEQESVMTLVGKAEEGQGVDAEGLTG